MMEVKIEIMRARVQRPRPTLTRSAIIPKMVPAITACTLGKTNEFKLLTSKPDGVLKPAANDLNASVEACAVSKANAAANAARQALRQISQITVAAPSTTTAVWSPSIVMKTMSLSPGSLRSCDKRLLTVRSMLEMAPWSTKPNKISARTISAAMNMIEKSTIKRELDRAGESARPNLWIVLFLLVRVAADQRCKTLSKYGEKLADARRISQPVTARMRSSKSSTTTSRSLNSPAMARPCPIKIPGKI